MRVLLLDGHAIGFANFRLQLLHDLRENGYEVVVAAPGFTPEIRSALPEGTLAIELPLDRSGVGLYKDLRSLWFLYWMMRKARPECVITFSPKVTAYGNIVARAVGVRTRLPVITGLGYGFVNKSMRARAVRAIQSALYRISFRGSATVFFQNPDDLEVFRSWNLISAKQRTEVLGGSGVDLTHFRYVPPPGDLSFLMVGRLLRSKGVIEYIRASAIVRRKYPDAQFRLVGWLDQDNPDCVTQRELDELLSASGVAYLGKLIDVRPEIERAQVFVLPSYREGTPRSTLEALATGRAVITTDAPGCRETVLKGVNGFLVPVGDEQALAAAMIAIADDPKLAVTFGKNSRLLAEQKFDVVAVNKRLLAACAETR